jgi:hypothetical protein
MNVRLSILIVFIAFFCFCFVQTYPCLGQPSPKDSLFLLAKNGEGLSAKEDSKGGSIPAIEEYEKEKLAKLKRNIGKRFMTVPTVNPAEFYESPDDLGRKLKVMREKEGFVITEVVQNRLGTMNFYRVKFDSGQTGYLSADGNYLEIKVTEKSLMVVTKEASTKKKSSSRSKGRASEAIELVKNHTTLTDPATGKKRSVEMRMIEQKTRSFPNLKWKYNTKQIGRYKYRVTQSSGEGSGPPLVRTWIVNLSTTEVNPENLAAKEMYRQ